jgi:hypothetical protein
VNSKKVVDNKLTKGKSSAMNSVRYLTITAVKMAMVIIVVIKAIWAIIKSHIKRII